LQKVRGFSYYDVEQFLREAGAEKVNEKAIMSFKEELEQEVKELIGEAEICATYAGRKNLIKCSDIDLASSLKVRKAYFVKKRSVRRSASSKAKKHAISKHAVLDIDELEEH
jgi:histone H3/H4